MKLAGESQAELIRLAAVAGVVVIVGWYAARQAKTVVTKVEETAADVWNAVTEAPAKAVSTVAESTRGTVINPYYAAGKIQDLGGQVVEGVSWTNPAKLLWEGVKAELNWISNQFQ